MGKLVHSSEMTPLQANNAAPLSMNHALMAPYLSQQVYSPIVSAIPGSYWFMRALLYLRATLGPRRSPQSPCANDPKQPLERVQSHCGRARSD